ncbi:MAG: hypothetical protein R3D44_03930 [Hyphomicrobiaceae bacterium]
MARTAGKSGDLCCSALDAVLHADEFEPCFTVDDDGVLCLTVGITDIDEDEPTLVLEPIIFCPFCGTRLQAGDAGKDTSGGAQVG